MIWDTKVERERRNRIRVAIAAYAYELEASPIMSDGDYDILAGSLNPQMTTGNMLLDDFFFRQFDPSTGMWIHKHPHLDEIRRLYMEHYKP